MSRPSPLLLTAAALAIATGCAKSTDLTPVGTSTRPVTIVSGAGSVDLHIRQDDPSNERVLELPLETVWRLLPAVYDSLGVDVTTVNISGRLFGADGVKIRRSLKGVPLSRYFDCGTTQIGANADEYEITLTLLTQARAASPTSTRVAVTTIAMARPVARRQNPQNCTILGTLDAKLYDTLRRQAASARD